MIDRALNRSRIAGFAEFGEPAAVTPQPVPAGLFTSAAPSRQVCLCHRGIQQGSQGREAARGISKVPSIDGGCISSAGRLPASPRGTAQTPAATRLLDKTAETMAAV